MFDGRAVPVTNLVRWLVILCTAQVILCTAQGAFFLLELPPSNMSVHTTGDNVHNQNDENASV